MRKIVPPRCDSCNDTADYESSVGVQFCYQCLYAAAGFLYKIESLDSNPLCELLFDGVWRSMDSSYEVWFRSPAGDFASRQAWIQRFVKLV